MGQSAQDLSILPVAAGGLESHLEVFQRMQPNRDPFVREDALQPLPTWQPAEYAKLMAAQKPVVAAR